MKIRNTRMFSYPVLSNMYDDYKNSTFNIKVEAQKNKSTMIITVEPIIECQPIIDLINNGNAKMIIHFECGRTRYRSVEQMHFGKNTYEFEGAKLNDNLQIIAFVIAKENIRNYTSNLFNDEYGNSSFNIEKGSIIGISNQPDVPVPKNIYDLSNINSIVRVIPDDLNDKNMIIEYDEIRIYIKLPSETFETFNSIGKEVSNYTPIIHSMLVVPALIHMLDMLAMEENWMDFERYIWFTVIKKKCEEKYGDFSQEIIKDKKATTIAQDLIDSPISSAMDNLIGIEV